jgi:hypothetical protein
LSGLTKTPYQSWRKKKLKTKIMKISAINLVMLLVAVSLQAFAQTDSTAVGSRWDKNWYWGASLNNAIVSFTGTNLPNRYFWRPSLGLTVKGEYFPGTHLGISVGCTFQAKGAGIITPDVDKSLGNPDSTYRARIKFYDLEVPIALVLRGLEPVRGTRLRAEVGFVPARMLYAKYIFLSVEDGFHFIEDQSNRYYRTDLFIQGALGLDINASEACIFQVHLYGNWGTRNIYNTNIFPGANGRNQVYGIRLGWMF